MSDQVNVLVCLSAQHSFIRITELHIYNLVNIIAPVLSIKLLSSEGELRALVQLLDHTAANFVIAELDGRSTALGQVRVLLSQHSNVDYKWNATTKLRSCKRRPLEQIVANSTQYLNSFKKQANMQESYSLFGSDSQNANKSANPTFILNTLDSTLYTKKEEACLTSNSNDSRPDKDTACPSTKNMDATMQSSIIVNNSDADVTVEITHEDVAQLAEKKVLKAFRRFGRVFNMRFDENRTVWILEYGTIKEVNKVIKVLNNDKLFGYKVYSTPALTKNQGLNHETKLKQSTSLNSVVESKDYSTQEARQADKASRSSLRIDLKSQTYTIESVCLAVARIHKPVQLSFAHDVVGNNNFCIADFKFTYEAGEVLVAMNQAKNGLSCRFAS